MSALAAISGPYAPPTDEDGTYVLSWEAEGRDLVLQELAPGAEEWVSLTYPAILSPYTVSDRSSGMYEYRFLWIRSGTAPDEYSTSTFVQVGAVEGQNTNQSSESFFFRGGEYDIYTGDINADGVDDLYLKALDKFILIHGEIITPILIESEHPDYLIESASEPNSHYLAPVEVVLGSVAGLTKNNVLASFINHNSDGVVDLSLAGSPLQYRLVIDGRAELEIQYLWTGFSPQVLSAPRISAIFSEGGNYYSGDGNYTVSWDNNYRRLVLQEKRNNESWINVMVSDSMLSSGQFSTQGKAPGRYQYRLVEAYANAEGISNFGNAASVVVPEPVVEPEPDAPVVDAINYADYEIYYGNMDAEKLVMQFGLYFRHKTDPAKPTFLAEIFTIPNQDDPDCFPGTPPERAQYCEQIQILGSPDLYQYRNFNDAQIKVRGLNLLQEGIDYYLEDIDGDGVDDLLFNTQSMPLYRFSVEQSAWVGSSFLILIQDGKISSTSQPDSFSEWVWLDIDKDGDVELVDPSNIDPGNAIGVIDIDSNGYIQNDFYYDNRTAYATLSGVTSGQFRVNESGAATYGIPLVLPRGTAGVAPVLSFNYSSQGGNGLLGKGWSLSGLEGIARCQQTLAQDGQAKPISWNTEDRFCFNGQRLIPIGGEGGGVLYKTATDSFERIIAYGSQANPTYFTVEAKDGSIKYYGDYPNVNAADNTSTKVLFNNTLITHTWSLGRFLDSAGNPIRYTYAHEENNDFRINKIYYTYTKTETAKSEVEFQYELRSDVTRQYVKGFEFKNTKRLKRIVVKNAEPDSALPALREVRRYNLHYGLDSPKLMLRQSHIVAVQECVVDQCVSPTIFNWAKEGDIDFLLSTRNTLDFIPEGGNLSQLTPLDINGDGFMDLAFVFGFVDHNEGPQQKVGYLLYNPEAGVFSKTKLYRNIKDDGSEYDTEKLYLVYDDDPSYGGQISITPTDYNADGRQDIIVFRDGSNRHELHLSKYMLDSAGKPSWVLEEQPILLPFLTPLFSYLDLDSDGLQDVIDGDSVWYLRPDASSTDEHLSYSYDASNREQISYVGFDQPFAFDRDSSLLKYYNQKDIAGTGDFNGDGNVDLIVVDRKITYAAVGSKPIQREEHYYVALKEGNTFHAIKYLGGQERSGGGLLDSKVQIKIAPYNKFWVADFNMDGYSDFLMVNNAEEGNDTYQFYLNSGAGFKDPVNVFSFSDSDDLDISLSDLTGDGYLDIQARSSKVGSGGIVSVRQWLPESLSFAAYSSVEARLESMLRNRGTIGRVLTADITGDGHLDMIHTEWQPDGHQNLVIWRNRSSGDIGNITSITNGLGAETHIDYELLSNTDNYIGIGQKEVSLDYIGASSACVNNCFEFSSTPETKSEFYQHVNSAFDDASGYENNFVSALNQPVFEYRTSQFVVTRVKGSAPSSSIALGPQNVNQNAYATLEYFYESAKYQAGGVGLLGFKKLHTADVQSGVVSTNSYRQDWPYTGLHESTVRRAPNGQVLYSSSNEYKIYGWQSQWLDIIASGQGAIAIGPISPYLYKSVDDTYNAISGANDPGGIQVGNDVIYHTEVEHEYDAYGNATKVTTTHSGKGLSQVKEIVNTYGGGEIVNFADGRSLSYAELARLTRVSAKMTRSGFSGDFYASGANDSESERVSEFAYYQSGVEAGLIRSEILFPGSAASLSKIYQYDDYGNIIVEESAALNQSYSFQGNVVPGSAQQIRRASYVYDSTGRYVNETWAHNTDTDTSYNISKVLERNAFGGAARVSNGELDGNINSSMFDAFGRVTSVLNEQTGSGSTTEYLSCETITCPVGAVYAVRTGAHGGAESSAFIDVLGRTVRAQKQIYGGGFSCVDYEFDHSGRALRASEPFNCASSPEYWSETEYDILGRVIRTVMPNENGGATQTYEYNGYTTVMVNPKGQSKTTIKNGLGELIGVQDELGSSLIYEYDSHGNIHKIKHVDAVLTEALSGDPSVIPPNGAATILNYDNFNRKISMDDPDKGHWDYKYNGYGELVWQRDAKGQVVIQDFDSLARKKNRIDYVNTASVEGHTRWYYDQRSDTGADVSHSKLKITSVVMADTLMGANDSCESASSIQCHYPRYDNLGRNYANTIRTRINGVLESHTTRTIFGDYGRVEYQFDALDADSNGDNYFNDQDTVLGQALYSSSLNYARYSDWAIQSGTRTLYDDKGFAVSVADIQTGETVYRLEDVNTRGQVTSMLHGNGVKTSYDYFEESGQTRRQLASIAGIFSVQDITYTWDEIGNLRSRFNDSRESSGSSVTRSLGESFCYDGLNRLVKTNLGTTATSSCDALSEQEQDLRYDTLGNIRYKKGAGYYSYTTSKVHAVSGIVNNGTLRNYIYDGNGNIDYDENSGGGDRRNFSYATFDKPTLITKGQHTTHFKYGIGRDRYSRTDIDKDGVITTTRYLGNVEKITRSNEPNKIEWKRYVGKTAIFTLVSDVNHTLLTGSEGLQKRYVYNDHLGSLDVITDGVGNIVQSMSFNAWGERRNVSSWNEYSLNQLLSGSLLNTIKKETTRGFTGHEMVDEVGIIHMNGRIYDPKISRFLQADPFVQAATNTQSCNVPFSHHTISQIIHYRMC